MNTEYPTVTIAAPIRNRAWILNQYLDYILKLDYPKSKINIHFVLNDSHDESRRILLNFKKNNKSEYNNINIDTLNRHVPEDARVSFVRNQYIYQHLSILRNHILSKVSTDYLFSVDSDILVSPDILKKLLSHKKDIVSGLIYNGYIAEPSRPYRYTNILKYDSGGILRHIANYKTKNAVKFTQPELIEVDVTGAVYLMTNKVCKSVRYGYHRQGEDIHFCNMAKENGFKIYSDLSAYCIHMMREGQFNN